MPREKSHAGEAKARFCAKQMHAESRFEKYRGIGTPGVEAGAGRGAPGS